MAAVEPDPATALASLHAQTKQLAKEFKKVRQTWKDQDGVFNLIGAFTGGVLSYPAVKTLTEGSKIKTIVGSVSVAAVVGLGSWIFGRYVSSVQKQRNTANNAANAAKSLHSSIEFYYLSHNDPRAQVFERYDGFKRELETLNIRFGAFLPKESLISVSNETGIKFEAKDLAAKENRMNNPNRVTGAALLRRVKELSEVRAKDYEEHYTKYDRREQLASFGLGVFAFVGTMVVVGHATSPALLIIGGAIFGGLSGTLTMVLSSAKWRSKVYAEGQKKSNDVALCAFPPTYLDGSDDESLRARALGLAQELQKVIDETNEKWENSYVLSSSG